MRYYLGVMKIFNKYSVFTVIQRILWFCLALGIFAFLYTLLHFSYIPWRWYLGVVGLLLCLLVLTGWWAFRSRRLLLQITGIILSAIVSLVCFVGAWYLPTLQGRILSIFQIEEAAKLPLEQPFTIYIAGNDQEGKLSTTGRYDVNMMVSINFQTHSVLITSIPRDSYLPNPAYSYQKDKLTHMGLNGIDNSMLTLSNTFATSLQHYVIVNFTTFRNIVNALGGVHVQNPYAFASSLTDKYTYPEGNLLLTGDEALFYVRERFNLVAGDFDRNAHQVIMLRSILKEILQPQKILLLDKVFQALQGNFLTNVDPTAIQNLLQYELDYLPDWNIINYHIRGGTGSSPCSSHGGEILSVVYPYEEDIRFIRRQLFALQQDVPLIQQELPSQR